MTELHNTELAELIQAWERSARSKPRTSRKSEPRAPRLTFAEYSAWLAFPFFVVLVAMANGIVTEITQYRAVAKCIRDAEVTLVKHRQDPGVHVLRVSRSDRQWNGLLIEVDVDDLATFKRIDADLDAIRFSVESAEERLTIRSHERPGNSLGGMAHGMGLAVSGLGEIVRCFAMAAVLTVLYWIWLGYLGLREEKPESAPRMPAVGSAVWNVDQQGVSGAGDRIGTGGTGSDA